MKSQRKYKGIWIPKYIWENPKLSAIEKVLFADISSMVSEGMDFFKSNGRIASDLKCSDSTAKRAIASLKELNLITVYRSGRKRFILLNSESKMNFQEGQYVEEGGQSEHPLGSTRPYSSTANKAFMNSLEENNLDIGDFYQFREYSPVQELIEEWSNHRSEMSRPLTQRQVEMAFENLFLVSLGDVEEATLSVEQAMMGGWSQFYPAKHHNDYF